MSIRGGGGSFYMQKLFFLPLKLAQESKNIVQFKGVSFAVGDA